MVWRELISSTIIGRISSQGKLISFETAVQLYQAGKLHEAEVAARQLVDANPRHVDAMNLLGVIAHDVGRNDLGVTWLQRAIRIDPSQAKLFNNLGECFRATGHADEAIACYRAAIERSPSDPNPRNNIAIIYANLGQLDAAITTWRELIAAFPDYLSAYNNLANTLQLRGHAREAVEYHRRAMQMDPDGSSPHSNMLRDLQHLPDITGEALLQEHRNWFKVHGERLARQAPPHENDRDPDRQLVVGWLSPDFRQHAVTYFFEPVMANFERSNFRFIAYSELPHEDEFSARLKGLFDAWRPIFGRSDEQVERQIRGDRVDILVDLAGHTSRNRAKLMCRRPAPVQVEYLGYPSTTGIETIQWRITDAKADPVGMTEAHYTEKLIRLPRTAWCYRPLAGAPEVGELSADRKGYVTFGSFNNLAKINPRVIAVWTKILQRVATSRLMLKYAGISEPSVRDSLRQQFAAGGVDPDRIDLHGRDPTERAHLARYGDIDIALDTFPYNGTTTTCEALWMGVPVVTVAGELHQARVGASLLLSVGLEDWVASDEENYISKAVTAAGQIGRLAELRRGLRSMMQRSPLRDEAGFTRDLEAALRAIWRESCNETI